MRASEALQPTPLVGEAAEVQCPERVDQLTLILGNLEFGDLFRDSDLVGGAQIRSAGSTVGGAERLVGPWEIMQAFLAESRHSSIGRREHTGGGTLVPTSTGEPKASLRNGASGEFLAVTGDLSPNMRLEPMDPGAAQFQLPAEPLGVVGAAPEAVAGFQDHDVVASLG
jgi:hypothetical protein